MISLPYSFDTASIWRTIVQGVLAGIAILLLLTGVSLIMGKLAAAVGFVLVLGMVGFFVARVRNFPMGAVGTISANGVVAAPVAAYGLPLNVPVGSFAIGDFQSIRFEERWVSGTSGLRRVVRVYLVGHGGTPEIQVATADGDEGATVARELGALLHLDVLETQPPGTKRLRFQVGRS